MDVLRVRVAAPDSPTVALWERHPAHPGGEVWLTGAGEFDVAATPAVVARLRDGRLVAVESVQEEEQTAVAPTPPAVGVWLSAPSSVAPGLAKFSRCSWWQMPVPGGENTRPYLAAMVRKKRWSSGLRKPICKVLWSA